MINSNDVSPAHTDFVKVRLNGIDTTMKDSLNQGDSGLSSRFIGLIVGLTSAVLILAAVIGFIIYRRRKNQTRSQIDNAGSPLTAYPVSPQKEGFGLLTSSSQTRIPRDSYDDPFQRRPNILPYTQNSFNSQHHPGQPSRKNRR
jgi:hypothetical protein